MLKFLCYTISQKMLNAYHLVDLHSIASEHAHGEKYPNNSKTGKKPTNNTPELFSIWRSRMLTEPPAIKRHGMLPIQYHFQLDTNLYIRPSKKYKCIKHFFNDIEKWIHWKFGNSMKIWTLQFITATPALHKLMCRLQPCCLFIRMKSHICVDE